MKDTALLPLTRTAALAPEDGDAWCCRGAGDRRDVETFEEPGRKEPGGTYTSAVPVLPQRKC